MIGILGEHQSDCEFLDCMMRRLSAKPNLRVSKRSFSGCGNLLRDGWKFVRSSLVYDRSHRFVVAIDADQKDPAERFTTVVNRVLIAGGIDGDAISHNCVVVPVQMIEAWLLADVTSLRERMFRNMKLSDHANPESLSDPKHVLINASKQSNGKPRYDPATHNGPAARYLDPVKVARACPSFRDFVDYVRRRV